MATFWATFALVHVGKCDFLESQALRSRSKRAQTFPDALLGKSVSRQLETLDDL
jgi:hypothetical protein